MPHPDFTPDLNQISNRGSFRFWCQKVLPLVYDDSLSYYELLCKVIEYLNNTMNDVRIMGGNIDALQHAYTEFQNYIFTEFDTFTSDSEEKYNQFTTNITNEFNDLQTYVDTFFDELDLTEEVSDKLDEMAASGALTNLLSPLIPNLVTSWLNDNVTPVGSAVVVDNSLTVQGAAADAKITGDKIKEVQQSVNLTDAIMSDGTFAQIYGLGAFSSTDHDFTRTNKYAFCLYIRQANSPHIIAFPDNMRWQYWDANGTFIAGVENSKFLILRDIAPYYLQISYTAKTFGYTYTEDEINIMASKMRILDGSFTQILPQKTIPAVVDSNLNLVYTNIHGGNWATHILHLEKYDVLYFNLSYAAPVYPTLCIMENGAPSAAQILVNSYGPVDGYFSAERDMDICICTCVYNSGYLDPPAFYVNRKIVPDKLTGKIISFFGDSYVANNLQPTAYTWEKKLCDKHGAIYKNNGHNGCGIIATRNDLTPLKDRLSEIDVNSDIIMLIGGENDANVSYDITNFETEFNTLIGNMLSQFPKAEIYCMCPWGAGSTAREFITPYSDAMKRVCNRRGVHFFDAKTQYLPNDLEIFRQRYYQTAADTSHLNNTGHDIFLNIIEPWFGV